MYQGTMSFRASNAQCGILPYNITQLHSGHPDTVLFLTFLHLQVDDVE